MLPQPLLPRRSLHERTLHPHLRRLGLGCLALRLHHLSHHLLSHLTHRFSPRHHTVSIERSRPSMPPCRRRLLQLC